MKKIRPGKERGHLNFGWLNTAHSFSFGQYFDPEHVHFRSLRVLNEDIIMGNTGFDTHPHKDMEIITFVMRGKLSHRDSEGNEAVVGPGEVQVMSAGSGIYHSEHNREAESVHLYQIWLFPKEKGLKPSYGQKSYLENLKMNQLTLLASNEESNGVVKIHQDAKLYLGHFDRDKVFEYKLEQEKGYYLQVIKGELLFDGKTLIAGDAAMIEGESLLNLKTIDDVEFLLFELA